MLQVRPEVYAFLVEPKFVPDIKTVKPNGIFRNVHNGGNLFTAQTIPYQGGDLKFLRRHPQLETFRVKKERRK
jgi:hypothetical protein